MIITKRYFWGFKKYNTRTGLYEGETRNHNDGSQTNWRGNKINKQKYKRSYR